MRHYFRVLRGDDVVLPIVRRLESPGKLLRRPERLTAERALNPTASVRVGDSHFAFLNCCALGQVAK